MHLLIEAGEAAKSSTSDFGAYLLYTLNFTTLVSGPIQRYDDFARDQFASEPIVLGPRTIGLQLERIIRGFFKVNVLAMLLHAVQEDALAQMAHPYPPLAQALCRIQAGRRLSLLSLCQFFRLHRHCDRPGAADARAPAGKLRPALLGFLVSGFLEPVAHYSLDLAEDICLQPAAGGAHAAHLVAALQPLLGVFCFFVTFFLIGIWHGRTSEFVFFGVFQGGGVAINKLWQLGLARAWAARATRRWRRILFISPSAAA